MVTFYCIDLQAAPALRTLHPTPCTLHLHPALRRIICCPQEQSANARVDLEEERRKRQELEGERERLREEVRTFREARVQHKVLSFYS